MEKSAIPEQDPTESPGEAIRAALEKRGWTQDDLARVMRRYRPEITAVISGKRAITAELAVDLAAALGRTPKEWMRLETDRQLSLIARDPTDVEYAAKLLSIAPIKEMERRGWIKPTKSIDDTEAELKAFFGVDSLDEPPEMGAATRKADSGEPLTPIQRAWCFRVRQLGRAQVVPPYRESALPQCEQALRRLAAYPAETHKVPETLAKFGIRFVIVQPLKSTGVDGVALWLDESSPVIGMSLLYDRNDSFWFTLFHELMHVKHRDAAPLDTDLTDAMANVMVVRDAVEQRANAEAGDALVPKSEMESFIVRVGPLYAKERIIRFAHRVKIHPGIIVGQLQRRDEIGYAANREMLAKIRHFIVPAAVTDGWGVTIDSRSLK